MKKRMLTGALALTLIVGSIGAVSVYASENLDWKNLSAQEIAEAKDISVEEVLLCMENEKNKPELTKEEFSSALEAKGMTMEEYKAMVAEKKGQPKMTEEEFEAALAEKGMTLEEYKAMTTEKLETALEAKGMTIEEYKVLLAD